MIFNKMLWAAGKTS